MSDQLLLLCLSIYLLLRLLVNHSEGSWLAFEKIGNYVRCVPNGKYEQGCQGERGFPYYDQGLVVFDRGYADRGLQTSRCVEASKPCIFSIMDTPLN